MKQFQKIWENAKKQHIAEKEGKTVKQAKTKDPDPDSLLEDEEEDELESTEEEEHNMEEEENQVEEEQAEASPANREARDIGGKIDFRATRRIRGKTKRGKKKKAKHRI
jgi:hypothetical protein